MDFPPAISGPAHPVPMPTPVSGVEFDHVSFVHPTPAQATLLSLMEPRPPPMDEDDGNWVLQNVSFQARAGTMTALVGSSGAGKTTITLLVPRFYDPQRGTVRLGGVDVRQLELTAVRRAVGMVTQDTYLLNDTLAANLRLFSPEADPSPAGAVTCPCTGQILSRRGLPRPPRAPPALDQGSRLASSRTSTAPRDPRTGEATCPATPQPALSSAWPALVTAAET